jgi:hypothetical protein
MDRRTVLAAMGFLMLGGVAHGLTKVQQNLVPVVPSCSSGRCNNGVGACSTTMDCNVGTLSLSSKLRADGSLKLKGFVKGLIDATGGFTTTDATLGSPDDYILKLCLAGFVPDRADACIYVHVDVAGGLGKIGFVATPLGALFPVGSAVELTGVEFLAPPTDPSQCRGNNDTTDPQAFFLNQVGLPTKAGCETGGIVGVGGLADGR